MISLDTTNITTVLPNYSWDNGSPLLKNNADFYVNSINRQILKGYAPYTTVTFTITGGSKIQSGKTSDVFLTYNDWDFNDHYNSLENKTTTIQQDTASVTHTFCMPGTYNISVLAREIYRVYTTPTYDFLGESCKSQGAYWRWSDTLLNRTDARTWNNTISARRTWVDPEACVDQYCVSWAWYQLTSDLSAVNSHYDSKQRITVYDSHAVTWWEALDVNVYSKTWHTQGVPDDRVCSQFTYNYYLSTAYTAVHPGYHIEVLEIPPRANVYCTADTYLSAVPVIATLCADGTVAGSFPIQKIVWDFDDGSDLFVVNREDVTSISALDIITYNKSFSSDPLDPRNYSVKHTYARTDIDTFYPSITAYSCNTNTSDSCSTRLGPVSAYHVSSDNFQLINARANNNSIILASNYKNALHLHKLNTTQSTSYETLTVNTPKNKIRNYPRKISSSTGYTGIDFQELLLNKINLWSNTSIPGVAMSIDYIVLTYQYDKDSGANIKTRTQITSPFTTNSVGWNRDTSYNPYMFWGGLNPDTGVESIFIDLTQFAISDDVYINCRAFWAGSRNSGEVSLDVKFYNEGEVRQSGYGFENIGGQDRGMLSCNANVKTVSAVDIDGDYLATIYYSKLDGIFNFITTIPQITTGTSTAPTPTQLPTNTPTPTRTPAPTPTITRTPAFTPTPTYTSTPTNTPTYTSTPTNTPTLTYTPTPTRTPAPTPSHTSTPTNSPTPSSTATL